MDKIHVTKQPSTMESRDKGKEKTKFKLLKCGHTTNKVGKQIRMLRKKCYELVRRDPKLFV